MKEVFEKIKQRIRICATEACGYTPLTRVVSEAELKEIIEQIEDECSNGHFGCNTNGEHERCDGCGLTNCKRRNKIWFGVGDDDTDTNVGSNGWIPVEEELPETDKYILLSFSNFSIPCVGRYEEDKNGGAFYIGDDDETCVSQDMFVNAWMNLPTPYQPKGE